MSGDRRIIMLLTIKHFYTQGRGSTLQIRWKIIMLGKTGGLFTDSKFDISHACFALYVATPMEFALAALFDLGLDRFEAAVAAHGSTPVGSSGVFLAHPSLCSWKRSSDNYDLLRIRSFFFNNTKDRFDAVLNAKTTSVCKLITTSKRVKEFCLETPLEECRFKKNVN